MEIIFLFRIILDISRSVSGQNSLKLNLNLDLVLENLKIMLIHAIMKFQILNNWNDCIGSVSIGGDSIVSDSIGSVSIFSDSVGSDSIGSVSIVSDSVGSVSDSIGSDSVGSVPVI